MVSLVQSTVRLIPRYRVVSLGQRVGQFEELGQKHAVTGSAGPGQLCVAFQSTKPGVQTAKSQLFLFQDGGRCMCNNSVNRSVRGSGRLEGDDAMGQTGRG